MGLAGRCEVKGSDVDVEGEAGGVLGIGERTVRRCAILRNRTFWRFQISIRWSPWRCAHPVIEWTRPLPRRVAKQVFQVAGEDARGEVVYEHRAKFRDAFTKLLQGLDPGVEVLMESGPGAQSLLVDDEAHAIADLRSTNVLCCKQREAFEV